LLLFGVHLAADHGADRRPLARPISAKPGGPHQLWRGLRIGTLQLIDRHPLS